MAARVHRRRIPDMAAAGRLRLALADRMRADVAREAGISWPLLDAYLRGSKPGAEKLARLAQVLSVPLDWLATGAKPRIRVKAPGYPRPRIRVKAIFQRVGDA